MGRQVILPKPVAVLYSSLEMICPAEADSSYAPQQLRLAGSGSWSTVPAILHSPAYLFMQGNIGKGVLKSCISTWTMFKGRATWNLSKNLLKIYREGEDGEKHSAVNCHSTVNAAPPCAPKLYGFGFLEASEVLEDGIIPSAFSHILFHSIVP